MKFGIRFNPFDVGNTPEHIARLEFLRAVNRVTRGAVLESLAAELYPSWDGDGARGVLDEWASSWNLHALEPDRDDWLIETARATLDKWKRVGGPREAARRHQQALDRVYGPDSAREQALTWSVPVRDWTKAEPSRRRPSLGKHIEWLARFQCLLEPEDRIAARAGVETRNVQAALKDAAELIGLKRRSITAK